jgi:hypothetical protein
MMLVASHAGFSRQETKAIAVFCLFRSIRFIRVKTDFP